MVDVVGTRRADVRTVVLQDDGAVIAELHELPGLAAFPGWAQPLLPVDTIAVEDDDHGYGNPQWRQEADASHLDNDQEQVRIAGGVF